MAVIAPRTPSGTLELLPAEQMAFQAMLDLVRAGYERFGFIPIETPVFELTDVLLTKSGGETEKQVYFVQSTGNLLQGNAPDMALRFDLTVPLARYVAQYERELAFPFRRYQIQRVYRGERAQRGRFREFYQCDIDIIGKDSLDAAYEAELPAVIAHVFTQLGVPDFSIHYNHRGLLRGLLETLGIVGAEAQGALLREIDKRDKIGDDALQKNLRALNVPEKTAQELLALFALPGPSAAVLERVAALPSPSDTLKAGLATMRAMQDALAAQGVSEQQARLNLSIARGLDYYTGTVYETFITGHEDWGSVCSGGRYDDLASHYTRSKLPGVGLSIGLTRLFDQLRAAGTLPALPSAPRVLVTLFAPEHRADSLRLATLLRQAGVNCDVWLEDSKLAKQFKYADKSGHRLALIQGPDEKAQGQVQIKDLKSGAQSLVAEAELVGAVHSILNA